MFDNTLDMSEVVPVSVDKMDVRGLEKGPGRFCLKEKVKVYS